MTAYRTVALEKWNRQAQYHFFKDYDNPFFNLTASIDVTDLWHFSKDRQRSFFLTNLFCSIKVANEIEEFRYRRRPEDEVICYHVIHCGSTILYDDNTFGFCYFEFMDDLDIFYEKGLQQIALQKQTRGLDPKNSEDNLIHYSTIPWVNFTSVQHARRFGILDTIPKITFGKYAERDGRFYLPLSVEVNHSMMDGYHVGLYFERFQALLSSF